tara:strand:- start:2333 stop:2704 length:372 start_codon:yes stop_codon:yes gene_type:complete
MPTKISFPNKINESVSVGDLLYVIIPQISYDGLAGKVPDRAANSVITEINRIQNFIVIPDGRNFNPALVPHFFYAKKPVDNNTSLKGYVLQARLKCDVSSFNSYDNSNKKLFSLGSEVTQSSK